MKRSSSAPHPRRRATSTRLRLERLEERRLLNSAPVAEFDEYHLDSLDRIGWGSYRLAAPGVLANDLDADGDDLAVLLVAADHGLAVQLRPDGGFDIQIHDLGFGAQPEFHYVVTDGIHYSSPQSVRLEGVGSREHPIRATHWATAGGGNGHTYVAAIYYPSERTIEELHFLTSTTPYLGRTGHLATLTTPEENAFASDNHLGGLIGAFQDASSPDYEEPAGGWRWVTEEPWEYSNWAQPQEPNNQGGEDIGEIWSYGVWNDTKFRDEMTVLLEFAEPGAFPSDDALVLPPQDEQVISRESLLSNDVFFGQDIEIEIVEAPRHADLELSPEGDFVFRADASAGAFHDRLLYRLVTDDFASSVATASLSFGGGYWPTYAIMDEYWVGAGMTLSPDGYRWSSLLDNDFDYDGMPLKAELVNPPIGGDLEFHSDGSFRFTPSPGFVGETSFTYLATDGSSRSAPARARIIVQPQFSPKGVSYPDVYFYVPGETLTISDEEGVLVNDLAYGTADFRVIFPESRTRRGGRIEVTAQGGFEYTPPPGYSGPDRFTYRPDIPYGGGVEIRSHVNLTTDGTFLDPTPAADAYTIDRTGAVVRVAIDGVAANDVGFHDSWSVRLVEAPQHGSLHLSPDGGFSYRADESNPLADVEDSFTYQLFDGKRYLRSTQVHLHRELLEDATLVAWPEAPGDAQREYLVASLRPITGGGAGWFLAQELAVSFASEGRLGHLPTITSVEEQAVFQEFLSNHLPDGGNVWLGARQDAFDSENVGGWTWVTGETTEYENWQHPLDDDSLEDDFGYFPIGAEVNGEWFATEWFGGKLPAPRHLLIEFSQHSATWQPLAKDKVFVPNSRTLAVLKNEGLLQGVGEGATVELASEPSHGDLVLEPDGSFTYVALTGQPDSFTYRLILDGEATEAATVWINSDFLPGDVDLDGDVDLGDFNLLKENFNRQGSKIPGDLNHDDAVDLLDFSILKANFNSRAEPAIASSIDPIIAAAVAIDAALADAEEV